MNDYSLGVALFDYVPVLLSAAGLLLLARGIGCRHHRLSSVALLAALLIPLGGVCKASWKLLIALGHPPLAWLENLLFILLAPGFVIMATGLRQARLSWQGGVEPEMAQPAWAGLNVGLLVVLGGAAALAVLLPDSRPWFFWLLAATILANLALLIEAGRTAAWAGLRPAVIAGLAISFTATLALSGLSRLPAGEATAWIQQSVNLLAQAALLYSLWHLSHAMREPD